MALDPKTREQIIKLHRDGKKVRDIEDRTGVARSSIYYVLDQEGIKPGRSKGGGPQVAPSLPKDLEVQVSDPKVGSSLVDALLLRVLEAERAIGYLQGLLVAEREWRQDT